MSDRDYIHSLIEQGEHEHQDFKFQINDARKIARSISAFANHGGGTLLVGVKDNGAVVGVSSDEEMYMVDQAATMYCRPEQRVRYTTYAVDGKTVLKVDIDEADEKPVKAPDDDGVWKVYYRVADENIMAGSLHARLLNSARVEAPAVINFTDRERILLDFLNSHGGITFNGVIRLVHVSRPSALSMVENLYRMGVVDLQYHDGQCLIVLSQEQRIRNYSKY